MPKPYCTHPLEGGGACAKHATQRVFMLAAGRIIFRCTEHKVSKAQAKKLRATTFDMVAESVPQHGTSTREAN
jgi:hypothetical protein